MRQELLDYMRENEISEDLLWRRAGLDQMCYVRDRICRELLRVPCYVVSTHYSKSIKLPVYEFEFNGIVVTMRENFYGWVISLDSANPIVLDLL